MDDQKQDSTAKGSIPEEVLDQILPVYGFERRDGARAVLFAAVVTPMEEGMTTHRSAIFTHGSRGWSEAAAGALEINGWSFAGRAEDRPEVWGIAEIDVAGPGPSLELLSSDDGGATWRHGEVVKVSRFASFVSLHMSRDGRGAITTELSENNSGDEGEEIKRGFYTHATIDGGANWSKASFSETPPPPPDGGALAGPDASYSFDEPPGAARVRELLNELES